MLKRAIEFNSDAGNLIDQSGAMLYSTSEVLTNSQIDVIAALHHNARILMTMSEGLSDISWAAVGVGALASLQLVFNTAMSGIETIRDHGRSR